MLLLEIYIRPPNTNITQFIDYIIQLLDSIKKENKIVYLIGEFNLNLLNAESHHLTSEFLETLYSYSFMPFINKPTRVQKNTASLIDNILSNSYDNPDSLSGILYTDVSDHFPIFHIIC